MKERRNGGPKHRQQPSSAPGRHRADRSGRHRCLAAGPAAAPAAKSGRLFADDLPTLALRCLVCGVLPYAGDIRRAAVAHTRTSGGHPTVFRSPGRQPRNRPSVQVEWRPETAARNQPPWLRRANPGPDDEPTVELEYAPTRAAEHRARGVGRWPP